MNDLEVRSRLAALVGDEPPFEQPAAEALDRAIKTGRGRRRRTISFAVTSSAAVLGVGLGAFAMLPVGGQTVRPGTPSSLSSGIDPSRAARLASEKTAALDPRYEADLRALAHGVAGRANEQSPVTMKSPQEAILDGRSANAPLRVDAWRAPAGQRSLAIAAAACRAQPGCAAQTLSATESVYVTAPKNLDSVQVFELVRELPDGASLVVTLTGVPSIDPGFDGEPYFTVPVVRTIVDSSPLVQ